MSVAMSLLLVSGLAAAALLAPPVGLAEPSVAPAAPALLTAHQVRATSVYVVGDSLTVGTRPYLKAKLAKRVRRVTIRASIGETTSSGISQLRSAAARHARVWVIALGTNDAPSAARTRSQVHRVMRMAKGKHRVVWVNVVRPGGYQRVNKALRGQDRRFHDLAVIDWSRFIAQHRRYLAGDGVHLNAAGYRKRGEVIASVVTNSARQPIGVTK